MDRITEIRAIGFKYLYGGNTEIKRLKGGPLVKQMMSNMEGDAQGLDLTKSYKFHMYSAHDDTVAAVMSTMGVFDPQIPSYASTFIVELHQDEETGKQFVNVRKSFITRMCMCLKLLQHALFYTFSCSIEIRQLNLLLSYTYQAVGHHAI